MSGIAGVYRLDGTRASAEGVTAMTHAMRRRGPDRRDVLVEGPVGLGHAMLLTTPESLEERLPVVRGPFAITADARIDNRDELAPLLAGHLRALGPWPERVPDSAYVLAAFAAWGERCPERLVGDFAFAVWDARSGRMVCARDPLGIKPFCFVHRPGAFFAFGSEPAPLVAHPDVDARVDGETLTEYLTGRLYTPTRTAYRGVEQLERAHVLVVTPDGLRRTKYWEPRPDPGAAAVSEPDAALLERFREAVRARTRSAFPVACELSGGLDSSSVTVIAGDEVGGDLHTVSVVFDEDAACDERPFIDAVLSTLGPSVRSHLVHPEREEFVALHEEILARTDNPLVQGNHYLNYLSFRTAREAGARVVLTGQDGDTTIGHGWERISELASASEWGTLQREAARAVERLRAEEGAYAMQGGYRSAADVANEFVTPVLLDLAERKRYVQFARAVWGLTSAFGSSRLGPYRQTWKQLVLPTRVLRGKGRKASRAYGRGAVPPTLSASAVGEYGVASRLADYHRSVHARHPRRLTASGVQQEAFESPFFSENMGTFEGHAAAAGVEARHPFMDVRLVEFCLGMDSSTKLRDGWTRWVFRQALRDHLPPAVRDRAGKTHLGQQQASFLTRADVSRMEHVLSDAESLNPWVDAATLRSFWNQRETLGIAERTWLSSALTATLWLRQTTARGG